MKLGRASKSGSCLSSSFFPLCCYKKSFSTGEVTQRLTIDQNQHQHRAAETSMTSGGIRTSVKAYIIEQRLSSLAVNHENSESINAHLAPLAEATMAAASSNSYGLCDGNMPCLPILSSTTKACEANQLPLAAATVSVNGQPLSPEEVRILQNCPNPPKKLKAGNYWYDKDCGFWGKEGQKPSELISAHLSVGDRLKQNASNGSTGVYINNREITKVELRMLQLVGVQFAGERYFWVDDDGSYRPEGQFNTRGSIWSTAGAKLFCAVLSLPFPSKSSNPVIPDIIEQQSEQTLQKILLVGCNGSGASTILKQAKILCEPIPFSVEERESIKFTIQRNVYGHLGILLEIRERFEDECLAKIRMQHSSCQSVASGDNNKTPYSIGPKLKAFADWLLKTVVSGYLENIFPAATREFAPFVEELLNDSAIQATYKRSSELGILPSGATYFIKRAVHILQVNYEPTDFDILYAEGDTSSNGLACVDFLLPQSEVEYYFDQEFQCDSLLRYQLIGVNAGLGESCEWLEMLGDVGIVIFCVSLGDYDQFSADSNGTLTNKILQSRAVFERIVTHPTFEQMNCLLLLNEFDLFVKKIARVPLTRCEWFDDFNPVIDCDLGHRAYEYVAVKFKRLYSSLTARRLYVSLVKDFEPGNVREALRYSIQILKWDEEGRYWCEWCEPCDFFSDTDSD